MYGITTIAPALPGYLGAVNELPAPAPESASALEVLRGDAPRGGGPTYAALVANSRKLVASRVSDAPEMSRAMVARAGLAWEVSEHPVFMAGPNGTMVSIPSHKAIKRDDTDDTLDVVRSTYTIIQNGDAFEPFDSVVSAGGAEYVGAGSFKGGRIVYAQAKLAYVGEVVPGDFVRGMILLSTGHTGKRAFRGTQTMIRVVCMNTLAMALATGEKLFKINHTRHAGDRVALASDAVKMLFADAARELEMYKRLAARKLDHAGIDAYIADVFPVAADAGKRAKENVRRLRADVRELVDAGNGTNIPGVRGSLWGAYNAVTEHVDHVRGRRETDTADEGMSRLETNWFGRGAEVKREAIRVAVKLVG